MLTSLVASSLLNVRDQQQYLKNYYVRILATNPNYTVCSQSRIKLSLTFQSDSNIFWQQSKLANRMATPCINGFQQWFEDVSPNFQSQDKNQQRHHPAPTPHLLAFKFSGPSYRLYKLMENLIASVFLSFFFFFLIHLILITPTNPTLNLISLKLQ